MKWQGRRKSGNIEDRRGRAGGGAAIGGVGLLAVLAIGYFLGIDVTPLLQEAGGQTGAPGEITAAERKQGDFVAVVLADTEEVWSGIFDREVGGPYNPTTLVLYSGGAQSPCGLASGATGPFYCPGDKKVYLDTGFFTTLSERLGAGGDFAAAYVVAHEVGHHVQDELGILSRANEARQAGSEAESNAISVRVELQADCYAGIFAAMEQAAGYLQGGDIAEAMNAAEKIGDDTLQKAAGRAPMPDSFTHGSSEQRQRWFARGFDNPTLAACDTFGAGEL
ncbi:KPN_02809 family neutral zinc metallopeptidase [Frigidibacter sp. ROC022]|uniref:KPN_02809 family neutral zinc metallopeptidase n=1 Tax=Frigidibacter sp. ROC022 TaxID=2971796 RepID=UPI00215B1051|nr:neutral zinc metallopeptidase [Frigidibacter sp. ROC022]MCR8726441.1 neutral zinc metallopeptidase [Frigidibacter sp. ROC022]